MRASLAAVGIVVCAMLAGCGTKPISNNPPSIVVTPNPVTTNGPALLTAMVQFTLTTPSWSLSGPGSLSSTTGFQVVYRPPSPVGATLSATVTATVDGVSATVPVTIQTPTVSVTLGAGKIPGLTGSVTVTYDGYDIPHIACSAAADCFAVQGYVQAHDRLFPMDFLRRVARGRVAELIGTLGLSQDVQLRTLFTTRDGDRVENQLAKAVDAATGAKLAAYVKGINAYLAELKATGSKLPLPGEYAQLPYPITAADIPDWVPEDIFALARLQQFQLSESIFDEQDFGKFALVYGPNGPLKNDGKMRAWVRSAPPPGVNTHTVVPSAPPRGVNDNAGVTQPALPELQAWAGPLSEAQSKFASLREALKPMDQGFGSNNWVIDAAHSATGKAMVANDPHLGLQYPPLFHLFSMTSSNAADGLDVAGGSFPGIPGALVGRGAHVGWGVTVVGYDVTDIYTEQLVPAGTAPAGAGGPSCPAPDAASWTGYPLPLRLCALLISPDLALVPIIPSPQSFKVRVGPGAAGLKDAVNDLHISSVPPVVIVVPHHGPIVALDQATGKGATARWTGQEGSTNDLKAFFGLNTAADVDAAVAALTNYTTGAQNFVLADDKGNIAYDPHALVPIRNFTDPTQTLKGGPRPPWFPLSGSGRNEWGTGNPADHCAGTGATPPARACWVADADLPFAKNPAKGYLATANADPIGIGDDRGPGAQIPAPFPNVATGGPFKNYLSFEWSDSTSYRHARITSRLAALTANGGKVSLADMQALQSDHYSLIGKSFAAVLANAAFDGAATANADFKAARDILTKNWSFDCPTGLLGTSPSSAIDPDPTRSADSAACYLFHGWLRTMLRNVFADDLGVAGLGVNGGAAIKAMFYMLDPNTPSDDKSLCNDVRPDGSISAQRSCPEQFATSLVVAYLTLTASKGAHDLAHPEKSPWRWGKVHTMQPVSQLALVTEGYQPGPFARPGGAFTVDVGNPSLSSVSLGSFAYGSSGNVRHISVMDAAAPIIKMQLPGPQRDLPTGNLLGPDLLGLWVANSYFDFPYQGSIAAAAVASQTFTAP